MLQMCSVATLCEIFLALVAFYLTFSPRVAERLYHPALFQPHKFPSGDYDLNVLNGIRAADITFQTMDGSKLHAWHFRLPGATRTILIQSRQHGKYCRLAKLGRALAISRRIGICL